jgi:predicted Zn-dependent protease
MAFLPRTGYNLPHRVEGGTMDLKGILAAISPAGAEWTGLRREMSRSRSWQAKDGRFESARVFVDEGCMVEVLYKGQFGYAAAASSDPGILREAADRALALARSGSERPTLRFGPEVRPPTVLGWETHRTRKEEPDPGEYSRFVVELSRSLRVSDKIVQTAAEAEFLETRTRAVSTSGADVEQITHIVGYGAQAIARDGNVTQRRTLNGPRGRTVQGGLEALDFVSVRAEAASAAEQALELLAAEECPSDRRTLVLAPDQMMLQIHESVGHPLELDRILGDERNYAGWSFVKLGDIGTLRYGSDLMNILFDPALEGELACYGADDIGNPARKEYIVKDGILVRALGSLESQARSGKPGVANQRACGWFRAPIDRMANLNLEPGKDDLAGILGSVERGVWMEANRSWSIDDYRNKFQFGCEYGKLIEDGRLTRTVRNPNYRGVSSSFWRNLYKVGDASTFRVFGTPNCGKGEPNQVIRVGHASPVCAFRDVDVFGGEA